MSPPPSQAQRYALTTIPGTRFMGSNVSSRRRSFSDGRSGFCIGPWELSMGTTWLVTSLVYLLGSDVSMRSPSASRNGLASTSRSLTTRVPQQLRTPKPRLAQAIQIHKKHSSILRSQSHMSFLARQQKSQRSYRFRRSFIGAPQSWTFHSWRLLLFFHVVAGPGCAILP